MENKKDFSFGILIEVISIAWMAVEFSVSFISGINAHSILLIAFGLDSLLEILSAFILLWRLSIEFFNPRSDNKKIDNFCCKMVSIILLLLCTYILITASYNLLNHVGTDASLSGMIIALLSLIIMLIIAYCKYRTAKIIGSAALFQDAMCSVSCAYLAATVLLGVVLNNLFNWGWIDSVAAFFIGFWIGKEALEDLI